MDVYKYNVDSAESLNEANLDTALELLPVSILILVLMTIGLLGNIIVCQFYGTITRQTPISRLIIGLAVIDAIHCSLMPKHIIDMCLSFRYNISVLCKTDAVVSHVISFSSVLMVILVAIFRHRMVCNPLLTQYSFKNAKYSIAIVIVLAIGLSVPPAFCVDIVELNLTDSAYRFVEGNDCNRIYSYGSMHLISSIAELVLFFLCSMILFWLYGKMGLKIWYFTRKRAKMQGNRKKADRSNAFRSISRYVSTRSGKKYHINDGEFFIWSEGNTVDSTINVLTSNENQNTIQRKKRETTNVVAAKQTFMLFAISVILLVSYFPHCFVTAYSSLKMTIVDRNLVQQLALRSTAFSAALNPFVYGFFNADFRMYVLKTICRCCNTV